MINAERIEEMKRLSSEAHGGKWFYDGYTVAIAKDDSEFTDDIFWADRHGTVYTDEENAQFIAESRQFVPDIIAAYEAQAEEIAELRKALEEIRDGDRMTAYKAHDIAEEALAWRNTIRK